MLFRSVPVRTPDLRQGGRDPLDLCERSNPGASSSWGGSPSPCFHIRAPFRPVVARPRVREQCAGWVVAAGRVSGEHIWTETMCRGSQAPHPQDVRQIFACPGWLPGETRWPFAGGRTGGRVKADPYHFWELVRTLQDAQLRPLTTPRSRTASPVSALPRSSPPRPQHPAHGHPSTRVPSTTRPRSLATDSPTASRWIPSCWGPWSWLRSTSFGSRRRTRRAAGSCAYLAVP